MWEIERDGCRVGGRAWLDQEKMASVSGAEEASQQGVGGGCHGALASEMGGIAGGMSRDSRGEDGEQDKRARIGGCDSMT